MIELRTLGDYNLIKQVGQGSLGTVYLAEHRFMKKQYILKLLPEELSSDRTFIQRFEEDVAVLSTLDHPNIVKIHTVSFVQGQYFLVEDCVVDEFGETTNLAQYILARGKRFDEATLYRLLMQVADALDYAHTKKSNNKEFIHRNLKLNNILVSKSKSGIDLSVSDFGLSRIIGTGAVLTRTYKAVAEALGIGGFVFSGKQEGYPNPPIDNQKLIPLHASFLQNFAFLAPEQRRLDSTYPITPAADVYAFGVLAYYLLLNEFPEGVFEMPSTVCPDLNWDWDRLVASCLQRNPERRPENLVEALESIQQKQTVQTQPFESSPKITLAESEKIVSHIIAEQIVQPELVTTIQKEIPQKKDPPPQSEVAHTTLRPIIKSGEIERPTTDHDPAASLIVDTTVKQYTPERKENRNIQPARTDMVVIQGGTFLRGSNDGNRDEMPRHHVTINSFAIDIHPVTNEQFVRFLELMGGEKDSNHLDIIRLRDSRIKRTGGKLSIESGYAKHPVVGVTWYGSIAYAKWIGKRLPTEAEWEIAARGGEDNFLYPTGDDIEKSEANFFSSDTTTVMSYAPNGYGLYDMAGNVYEWCYDWYGYNYYEVSVQEPENPAGPLQGVYRVLRGGCWKSLKEDLRCSRRHRNNPGTVNGTYGFRCAADVQTE